MENAIKNYYNVRKELTAKTITTRNLHIPTSILCNRTGIVIYISMINLSDFQRIWKKKIISF